MTEALYSWIKNLACYFILLTAVMNFLPDNSYKKYIRYYMGLLLILLILSPVFEITGMEEKMEAYITEFQSDNREQEAWRQRAEAWEKEWNQKTVIVEGQEVVP